MKLILFFPVLVLWGTAAWAIAPHHGYIVKFKNTQSFLADRSITEQANIEKVSQTGFGNFAKIVAKNGLIESSLELLKNNPNIEYVEPNYIVHGNTIAENITRPNDTFYEKQWGLENTGDHNAKKGEDIDILKAWQITKGSKKIKIAVVDSGIDYTHPDLKNQIDINMAEFNGQPGVDDDGNGFIDDIYGYNFADKNGDSMDGEGHGTHCAGVIGAQHDGQGIAGVMANVSLIPVRFLKDNGDGEDLDAVLAIDYALKRGANIISNSWGGDQQSQAIFDAVKAAEKAGVVFVAAAGNENADNDTSPSYPANFDLSNVISVGAFTNSGKRASFSSYGAKSVHVFAPGEDIYSTINKGEYDWMSGTSMATPFVSGVAGLLLSVDPNLTPLEVRERLIRTSTDNSFLKGYSVSNGRVDAYRALINQ